MNSSSKARFKLKTGIYDKSYSAEGLPDSPVLQMYTVYPKRPNLAKQDLIASG